MSALEKVKRLIVMASADGMAIEEARAMALTAVRLIVRDGLVLSDPFADVVSGHRAADEDRDLQRSERAGRETIRRWPDAGPTPRARAVRRADGTNASPATADRMVTAKAAGFCSVCGDAFPKGERVVWRSLTQDISHLACHASARTGDPIGL